MNTKTGSTFLTALIIGDLLAILLVTLLGFVFHGESIANPRWLTTFIPFTAAWGLQAPWFGLYRPAMAGNIRQAWWRAALAALLAAPMAGLLRAILLGSVVSPVFVTVLALTGALGMGLWRLAYTVGKPRLGKNG